LVLVLVAFVVWDAAFLLTLLGALDPAQVDPWGVGTSLFGFAETAEGAHRMLLLAGAAVAGPIVVSWLLGQLRPGDSSTRHVLLADEEGFVLVDSQGIESVASGAALRAPGVVEVDVQAYGAGSSPVAIQALVGIHPGASVEAAGRAVRDNTRAAVEQLVGIRVSDVTVDVRVLEPDELGRGLV
jgi:hypothetical protein